VTSIHAFIVFFQHQAASLEGCSLWIEWSQARSDQVDIDKQTRKENPRKKPLQLLARALCDEHIDT
jgi:hypothetical protein